MADEKVTEAKGKNEAVEPEVEKVERTRLISDSHQYFGVGPHVVAGALHDYGHGDSPLDVESAREAIDKFLKRKVKE